MPPAIAPTTANGIAIMNNTLGLKARPNESFNAVFQPGQAKDTVVLNKMMTTNKRENANLNLSLIIEQTPATDEPQQKKL